MSCWFISSILFSKYKIYFALHMLITMQLKKLLSCYFSPPNSLVISLYIAGWIKFSKDKIFFTVTIVIKRYKHDICWKTQELYFAESTLHFHPIKIPFVAPPWLVVSEKVGALFWAWLYRVLAFTRLGTVVMKLCSVCTCVWLCARCVVYVLVFVCKSWERMTTFLYVRASAFVCCFGPICWKMFVAEKRFFKSSSISVCS